MYVSLNRCSVSKLTAIVLFITVQDADPFYPLYYPELSLCDISSVYLNSLWDGIDSARTTDRKL